MAQGWCPGSSQFLSVPRPYPIICNASCLLKEWVLFVFGLFLSISRTITCRAGIFIATLSVWLAILSVISLAPTERIFLLVQRWITEVAAHKLGVLSFVFFKERREDFISCIGHHSRKGAAYGCVGSKHTHNSQGLISFAYPFMGLFYCYCYWGHRIFLCSCQLAERRILWIWWYNLGHFQERWIDFYPYVESCKCL